MFRNLRNLLILGLIAGVFSGERLRVARCEEDDAINASEESSDGPDPPMDSDDEQSRSKPLEPEIERLVPLTEDLLKPLEPETSTDQATEPASPPYRWLDENYQFLNEGDPYYPGQDPFKEWYGVPVGWFAGIDINVVHPDIRSQVNNSVLGPNDLFTGTFTNSTQLPVGDMNWTVMPKVHFGYRRENGLGEYIVSYRYVQSEVDGTLPNFDALGTGQLNSRLRVHVLDFDYAWTDLNEAHAWFVPAIIRKSAGLRFASAIFDTVANGRQVLEESAGNVFLGLGPRVDFEGTWPTSVPSLCFIGGADVSGVIGFNYQRFAETAIVGGSISRASGRTDGTASATPILGVQAGLSWIPDWRNRTFRFSAGYRWERWWILTDTNSENELTLQGPFVRGEFRF